MLIEGEISRKMPLLLNCSFKNSPTSLLDSIKEIKRSFSFNVPSFVWHILFFSLGLSRVAIYAANVTSQGDENTIKEMVMDRLFLLGNKQVVLPTFKYHSHLGTWWTHNLHFKDEKKKTFRDSKSHFRSHTASVSQNDSGPKSSAICSLFSSVS